MELITKGSLADMIENRKKSGKHFTDEEIIKMAANMTLGLLALHLNGFYHRDFKPENILIGEENGQEILKLTDFGLAKYNNATV